MTDARWWCPEAEENVFPTVSGTGTISTLQEPATAKERAPLGFRAPDPPQPWGECAWTARDIMAAR